MTLFPVHRRALSIRWIAAAMFLVALGSSLAAFAQNTEGIVVQGVGIAKGKPTQVEITATISADAELAADATVKYRDSTRRAVSTMEALRNSDLSLDFSGFAINSTLDAATQQLVQRGQVVTPPKSKVQVSESCRIILKNIDKTQPEALIDALLKIVDTAKDAGFQINSGPAVYFNEQGLRVVTSSSSVNSLVAFKILDNSALREQAYKAAIDDAKTKAQKLADASGVKLGRVLSIQDSATRATTANSVASGTTDEKSMLANNFGDISFRVSLTVQFEIVK